MMENIQKAADVFNRKTFQGKFSRVYFRTKDGEKVYADLQNYTLNIFENGKRFAYDIDLERCLSGSHLLDWIMQVEAKIWMNPSLLGLTVMALDECLQAQRYLCGFGRNHKITNKKFKEVILKNLRETIAWRDEWSQRGIKITWE